MKLVIVIGCGVSGLSSINHNYGHGGAGFTLSWGCADEMTSLASKATGC